MKKDMRMVFMGPPGSGKGTWSKIVTSKYGLLHLSTGDLLRKVREEDTPLARKVRSYMDSGALVPDDIVIEMVDRELTEGEAKDGFVFDGFPRTLPQAEALDRILERAGKSLDLVIDLDVEDSVLVDRIVYRVVCSQCGQPYNLKTKGLQPKVEGVCDKCGGALVKRSDDTEETLLKRLEAYREQTAPLLDYYEKQGKRYVFKAVDTGDAARQQIFDLIEEALAK